MLNVRMYVCVSIYLLGRNQGKEREDSRLRARAVTRAVREDFHDC